VAGDLLPIEDARVRIIAAVRQLPAESVPAADALGRVLGEDVATDIDLPPFDSSAMDGYAVVAGPAAELPIVGESRAGHPFDGVLLAGEAVRISTGAVVPQGADAIVPVERTEETESGVRVPDTKPGAHVRRAGEDVRAGEIVMRPGTAIGPAEAAMLAALGREFVECTRRPRVAVLATGDELRPAGERLGPGQIHDSNATALAAQATQAGAEVVLRGVVEDTLEATSEALSRALAQADVVCVSGGVSVGVHDHVRPALSGLGVEQLLWGVRLKPGKPLWAGVRDGDGGDRKLVFGLPGNPVSAMVTFQLFVRPALRALQGGGGAASRSTGVLDSPVERTPEREQAVRCRLRVTDDGFHVEPTGAQGSHVLSSMLGAGALAMIPAGDGELPAGSIVAIEIL
jgi:molybdopterin molybdotransferase